MKKIVLGIVLSVYILISIGVTAYLLNFNDYAVSQLGKYTIIVMDDDIGQFKKEDIVIIKKNENKEIAVDDYIFFYDVSDAENVVNYGKVNKVHVVHEEESTYTMSANFPISSKYVIGKGETSTTISGFGGALNMLSSQWGFLGFIIFPVLVLFIVQIYYFKEEIKGQKKSVSKKKKEE